MFERNLWESEFLKGHEGKYAVKLSITELFKISRK